MNRYSTLGYTGATPAIRACNVQASEKGLQKCLHEVGVPGQDGQLHLPGEAGGGIGDDCMVRPNTHSVSDLQKIDLTSHKGQI